MTAPPSDPYRACEVSAEIDQTRCCRDLPCPLPANARIMKRTVERAACPSGSVPITPFGCNRPMTAENSVTAPTSKLKPTDANDSIRSDLLSNEQLAACGAAFSLDSN